MAIVENNRESWDRLYTQYRNSGTFDQELSVHMDRAGKTSDMTDLRYLFPLLHQLSKDGKISSAEGQKIKVKIRYSDPKSTSANDDIWRSLPFLTFLQELPYVDFECYLGNIKIDAEKESINGRKKGNSRLFPICSAAKQPQQEGGVFKYTDMRRYIYWKCGDYNELDIPSALRPLVKYVDGLLNYIDTPGSYSGNFDNQISAAQKEVLRDRVQEELKHWRPEMTILSQSIWLFLLCNLIEAKDLYTLPSEAKQEGPHIRQEVLTKSRMDAISYSEAMYQLIENACEYSKNHQVWFGCILHRAGRNGPMSQLVEEVDARKKLYQKYWRCFAAYDVDKNRIRRKSDNIFNSSARFFFEFFVLNGAKDENGMVDHFNEKHPQEPVPNINELIQRMPRETSVDTYIEDLTVHYGLRLLKMIVAVNRGYLVSWTPSAQEPPHSRRPKGLYYFNGNTGMLDNYPAQGEFLLPVYYYTEWNAILPADYQQVLPKLNATFSSDSRSIFGDRIPRARHSVLYLDCDKLLPSLDETCEKKVLTNNLTERLFNLSFWKEPETLSTSILAFCFQTRQLLYLELLAKALFACIAKTNQNYSDLETPPSLRIALLLPTLEMLYEFLRLFSIFYIRGRQAEMKNVQVAFCLSSEKYPSPQVNFILAGDTLKSAYETAKIFTYHNTPTNIEFLPLLDYLTDQSGPGNIPSVFPFDLFLPTNPPMASASGELVVSQDIDPWKDSWFLAHMRSRLEKDIREHDLGGGGCKISGVHIRLGSKLHVERFYEGELLFHDSGNVMRFAYLLVQELLYGPNALKSDQHIVLLGYEKYSIPLMQQIEYWLKHADIPFNAVQTAIIYDGEEAGDVIIKPCYQPHTGCCSAGGELQVISILPVGTTLSTIYKMHNIAMERLDIFQSASRYDFRRDFCLILVNRDLFSPSNMTDVTLRYWANIDPRARIVTTQPEESDAAPINAKYLLPADAEWMAPDSCSICQNTSLDSHAVIGAKHSNTMPGAIFTLWGKREGRFKDLINKTGNKADEEKYKNINHSHFPALFGAIKYSHLYSQYNHFQFYLDFTSLYLKNRSAIDKEIRQNWHVDQAAFHLVVSPLQYTNAPFVKTVLDLVFHGNVRFLHINLADIYREETRTKFSYIAAEFKALQSSVPSAKFCIHFADTSIVTGNLLSRAKLLIKMLLHQVGCPEENVELFSKIFLLVNRCSYDTLHAFVKNPPADVFSYICLGIPSYNTENDYCPACRLENRYHLLEKRSSTQQLSLEFFRLGEKHKKRTSDEYDIWLRKKILHSHSYFDWLKQWLFTNVPAQKRDLSRLRLDKNAPWKNFPGHLTKEDYSTALRVKQAVQKHLEAEHFFKEALNSPQEVLQKLSRTSLQDVIRFTAVSDPDYSAFQDDALRLIQTYLIDVRAYMRLYTMQLAYEALEVPNKALLESSKALISAPNADRKSQQNSRYTHQTMLELISKALLNMDMESNSLLRYAALAQNVERLISYIKVLSREQIVNYYHCRQAITGIMSDMLQLLGLKSCSYTGKTPSVSFQKTAARLVAEDKNWAGIIEVFQCLLQETGGAEQQMCAQLEYQLLMILLHRSADLQNTLLLDPDNITALIRRYYSLTQKYFNVIEPSSAAKAVSYFELPPQDQMLLRYLKSLKLAAMSAEDDTPCLALTDVSAALSAASKKLYDRDSDEKQTLLLCARYIYIENIRMLYSGMQDLSKRLQKDMQHSDHPLSAIDQERPVDILSGGIYALDQAIDTCLRRCYQDLGNGPQEKNLLYQNLLGNFCRFWHKSTGSAPIAHKAPVSGTPVSQITFLLQYFRRLNSLSTEYPGRWSMDDLPYLYEELCRIICGFTGFQMCYMVYRNDSLSQIFAQSGYYVDFMLQNKILRNIDIDQLLCRAEDAKFPDPDLRSPSGDIQLIPGVFQLQKEGDNDYLVVSISTKQAVFEGGTFYIILQASQDRHMFDSIGGPQPYDSTLQKARNILFMRHRLQEVFTRDRTVLLNFRFDCSYIRPIRANAPHTYVLHISDLHVHEDISLLPFKLSGGSDSKATRLADQIANNLREWENAHVDLLAVTGDIVDSRLAAAPQMESNYKNAEKLLTEIVAKLWRDEQGYLPHDWRRRVMIVTGNHDYAAMNQFKAVIKRRVLTSGMPVDSESGTMSKFAYFIDFLIRYLDPPIDELIRDDLNEIRNYRNLGIKVLMLNCSGTAVPRRTNKMGVNLEKVQRLLKRKVWDNQSPGNSALPDATSPTREFRMCLAHYSPEYNLSYFLDDYDALPGWEWDPKKDGPIKLLVTKFQESLQDAFAQSYMDSMENIQKKDVKALQTEAHKAFQESFSGLTAAMHALENNVQQPGSSGKKEEPVFYEHLRKIVCKQPTGEIASEERPKLAELIRNMRQHELFQQIERYNEWLDAWLREKRLPNSELLSQLFVEVKECLAMSAFDKDVFDKILKSAKNLNLYLAGHIHAYAEEKSGDCRILVADKLFYDQSDNVRGFMIQVSKKPDDKTDPLDYKRLI